MNLAAQLALGLAAFGSVYMLLALAAVARFVRRKGPSPGGSDCPSVTILKPLHGDEPKLLECLASFCEQDYGGRVRIVCGVQSRADPAIATVRELMARYPRHDIQLVVDPTPQGSNGKVANLINMSADLRDDVVVLSDSDIRVGPDWLSRVVAELHRPGVGAVTCLYYGEPAVGGLWPRMSALAINGHFLAGVVVGMWLDVASPCFGSTIALRRETLARIGGFAAIKDDLADDYALGKAVRDLGLEVVIPPLTVAHSCRERTAGGLWRHELRWARTVRLLDPVGYFGTVLGHPFAFALIGAALALFEPLSVGMVIAALGSRIVHCAGVARCFGLPPQPLWLLPLRDVLSFAGFLWSFVGGRVSWRGEHFQVLPDGTLAPARRPAS